MGPLFISGFIKALLPWLLVEISVGAEFNEVWIEKSTKVFHTQRSGAFLQK